MMLENMASYDDVLLINKISLVDINNYITLFLHTG
jgi:hypothetical protein